VLDAFEATLAWRRGGEAGLEEALRAGTVNHLVLEDGLAVTGRVTRLARALEAGPVRLAILEGPGLVSRDGVASGTGPWQGTALVVLAAGTPPLGPFRLEGPGGLFLEGFGLEAHAVTRLRGSLGGRDLDLPAEALLFLSATVPSVVGGPGDPESWDRWCVDRDAKAQPPSTRVEALAPDLAARYREVRAMREGRTVASERLREILEEVPGDWLLREEVQELLDLEATPKA